MATMIELLGQQAVEQNEQGLLGGLGDAVQSGLKTGVGLAKAKQEMEANKLQVASMKEDLAQKQAMGLGNRLRAALFSTDEKIFDSRMKLAEAHAAQTNVPFAGQAIKDLWKNEQTRSVIQRSIKDVVSGKVPPAEFLSLVGDQPALYDYAEAGITRNSESQNKFSQEKEIVGLRAQTQEEMMQARQQQALAKEDRARVERDDVRIKGDAEKLSKEFAKDNLPEVVSSIKNIDKLTGGLYSDVAAEKLDKIAGKKGFIASVSIPWTTIKPFESSSFKGDDLKLFQSVSSLRNQYLKLRSGGAVTDPEADRFLQELGSGGVRTGEQLANGLRSLSGAVRTTIKNKEAGADPRALETYKERGGGISSGSLPKPGESVSTSASPGKAVANMAAAKKLAALPDKARARAALEKQLGRALLEEEAALFPTDVAGGR
jgi:hypothetical protein